MTIKSGPGGFEGLGAIEGLKRCAEMGLNACEVEFTYGVNMNNEMADEVGKLAKSLNISLSIHAPYYINLSSDEKKKISASKKRILQSVERGHHMGAEFVVFHPAYYGKRTPEETYALVKEAVVDMLAVIKKNGWTPLIATETTGKPSAFGSLDELERLSRETGCAVCIDFAHLRARNNGVVDYDDVMKKIKRIKAGHITAHFSGIEWTAKGERRHLVTEDSLIKDLLTHLKKHNINIRVINESPEPMHDAQKTIMIAKKLGIA
jgi:deoxyribonuclease-4